MVWSTRTPTFDNMLSALVPSLSGSTSLFVSSAELGESTRGVNSPSEAIHVTTHRLLPAMMQALGIDAARIDAISADELGQTCLLCPEVKRCRQALAAGCAAQQFKTYCPNSIAFAEVRSRQG
jgi:hypothetical protein